MGNSITVHPVTSYWWGCWGMAATTRDKDWVHVMNGLVKTKFHLHVCFSAFTIVNWERAYDTFDKTLLDTCFSAKADFVVIRLGENAIYSERYEPAFSEPIQYVQSKEPSALIVVTGCFWPSSNKEPAQKKAAAKHSCAFVSLEDLFYVSANLSTTATLVYGDDETWHSISEAGIWLKPSRFILPIPVCRPLQNG
ncbi:MAG: hypothetical protein Q8914_13290 [Bacteroidota bacterium]|nr:hypothetical protein [Bacteroidota bacterium]